MIHQIEPRIGNAEVKAVTDYLQSGGWLTEHTKTREFEEALADFLGVKHCILTTSGTTALYLAYYNLKIPIGRESSYRRVILVPDLTMIATASAVLSCTHEVMLSDIDKDTLCLDLDYLESILPHEIMAVAYVSLNGRCGDMERLRNICRKKGWYLVEDACQSFGSKHKGKYLGTYGDIGCFSLTPHKIITTGQGGFVVTDSDELNCDIRKLKDFGRVKPGVDEFDTFGMNFKYTDLQAVIGLAQLESISWRIQVKRDMYAIYYNLLGDIPESDLYMFPLGEETVPWFVDIYTPHRDKIARALSENEIGARPLYPPLHEQFPYKYQVDPGRGYNVTKEYSSKGLWLPSSLTLTQEDIIKICDVIKEVCQEGDNYGKD
jgi:perosamine synthetase